MMQAEHSSPMQWAQAVISALQWPALTFGAFAAGRYLRGVEKRAEKAEKRLESITERHLPSIHRMLAEIRGLLIGSR